MTLVVTEPCKGCKDKSCLKVCPVDCFYEDSEMVYINPDECVDCEACIPECPVEAIFYEDDVPMQWFNSRLTHPLTRETVGCKPTRARKRPP